MGSLTGAANLIVNNNTVYATTSTSLPYESVVEIGDNEIVRTLRAELGEEFFVQLRDLARAGKSVMAALDGRHETRALERAEVVDELKEIASTLQ